MKIAIVGGGPGGPVPRRPDEAARPAPTRSPCGSATPRTTPSASAWCSPTRPSAASRTPTPSSSRPDGAAVRPVDRHRHRLPTGSAFTVGGQGFAAMSRKELLQILQERVAAARRRPCTTAREAPDVDELRATHDLVVAADGAQLRDPRAQYADVFGPDLDRRHNKYIWLGTDLVFEAFQFFVKQTQWGTMQIHGYPYSDAGSTFIVEMHEDVWRARRLRRAPSTTAFPPGASDEYAVARIARDLRRRARRPRDARPTTPSGSTSPPSATSAGTTATWCCSATRRTPRTSRSAPAPSWPWRTRSRWRPACTSTRRRRRRSTPTRPSAGRSSSRPSARRRPRSSGSRTSACTPTRTRRSSCFNLLTRSRRITFENLRDRDAGLRRPRWRPSSRAAQGRATVAPGDVPAGPDRRRWS